MKFVKQTIEYWCSDITRGNWLGQGIRAAILDTGVSDHPDLRRRILDFRDFTGRSSRPGDDSGHGTHVAGILAGDGTASSGLYAGMAPRCELIIGKVLDREGKRKCRYCSERDRVDTLFKKRLQHPHCKYFRGNSAGSSGRRNSFSWKR